MSGRAARAGVVTSIGWAVIGAWVSMPAAWAQPAGGDEGAQLEARCDRLAERQEWLSARDCFGALLVRLPPGHPDRTPALYNRAFTVERTGDTCAAERAWAAYLDEAPRSLEAERRLKAAEARDRSALACAAARAPGDLPPPPPSPVPSSQPERDQIFATLGLGYGADGQGDGRTAASVELGYARLFGPLALQAAVWVPLESPFGLGFRPGVRLELDEGAGRPFLHAGLRLQVATEASGAGIGGIGYIYRVDPALGLVLQGDGGWQPSADRFFVEGRLGVAWQF